MERIINTKFYTYSQNNSGGSFITNDDVREYLIIEAISADDANSRAEKICENYMNFCTCCGERWSFWQDENDGTDAPEIYGDPAVEYIAKKGWMPKTAIIHYYNGDKEIIDIPDVESHKSTE